MVLGLFQYYHSFLENMHWLGAHSARKRQQQNCCFRKYLPAQYPMFHFPNCIDVLLRFHRRCVANSLSNSLILPQIRSAFDCPQKMAPVSFKVNTEYAQISELIPRLYISGVSALSAANMKAFNIALIVNATKEVPNLKSLGEIQRMKLWVDDVPEEDLFPHFDIVVDQIHAVIQDGGSVLVHCVAGVSRSASICLAYLTKYYCRSLRDAYHLMCSKRPMVRPNLGFWRQLIHYEQLAKGNAGSVRIVRDEAQPDKLLPDVYLKCVIPERPVSPERADAMDESLVRSHTERERKTSGSSGRLKFQPVLAPLAEIAEAAAYGLRRQSVTEPNTPNHGTLAPPVLQ
ncbi:dual specificity phosphatase, catalytic domain-containing protein [Ditylenchus destructor]|nr:dual specificity phosphatase, catalytic domain-containing protein [Ditylenchus destructor]